jgi:hypothetical protein
MYHGCTVAVIALYLPCINYGCIRSCTLQWAYTPVFLHTLAITSLGPSPSGHPVFGISSPWVWLLGDGGSHGMAGPDMLFCRQGMLIPASWQHVQLDALQQKPLLGRHPDGAPTVQAPDLTYWAAVGAKQGTINSEKSQSSPREEPK